MSNKLLCFEKPKKIHNTQKHNEMYLSDSGIAGTYVPNMSTADMKKWKAKHITGDDERIEIRKTFDGVQLLIVVYKNPKSVKYDHKNIDNWHKRHQSIKISMNGKLDMEWNDWWDLTEVVKEALEILL